MLEQLCSINTLDDITTFGYDLLQGEGFAGLQKELRNRKILFSREDYWTQEMIDRKVKKISNFQGILDEVHQEKNYNLKVLHMLQLVRVYCPATSATIRKLFKKCTVDG